MDSHLDFRDLEVLRFLAGRAARGEGPPSIREVARAAGLKSPRSGHVRLHKLAREGYIEVGEGEGLKRRPVRVTGSGWETVGEMPALGNIAAGPGMDAVAQDGVYSLVAELASPKSGKRRFVLKASGQSMTGAGIEDGDELVIEEDESPPDGTVVVVLIRGDQVTVKRLFRAGESGDLTGDLVRLAPANPDYEDILIPAEEVQVQGRVIRVLHPPRS